MNIIIIDIELVPVEWIEAIIRIADRKYDVERLDTKVELLLNVYFLLCYNFIKESYFEVHHGR